MPRQQSSPGRYHAHPVADHLSMDVPRLTVGLPVYNGEKYIAESIEALLGQSYADFELLISDNASTDSTG